MLSDSEGGGGGVAVLAVLEGKALCARATAAAIRSRYGRDNVETAVEEPPLCVVTGVSNRGGRQLRPCP